MLTNKVNDAALRLLAGEPAATALVTADGTLTYAELDERAGTGGTN